MNERLWPGWIAILFGCLFLLVTGIYLLALQYRRYGRLSWGRSIGTTGVVVYLFALGAYTMLPLPASRGDFCATQGHRGFQKEPLNFLHEIQADLSGPMGAILRDPAFVQVALNVLLFIPLGLFAVRWLKSGFLGALALGALATVAIEMTQYTGVWGLFGCAYRFADVDDLMANFIGALIGAVLAYLPVFAWLGGPARNAEELGPRPLTRPRRLLGMVFDVAFLQLVWLLVAGIQMAGEALGFGVAGHPLLFWAYLLAPAAAVVFAPGLGRTRASWGQRCVWIGAVSGDGASAGSGRTLLRALLGAGGFSMAWNLSVLMPGTGLGGAGAGIGLLLLVAAVISVLLDPRALGVSIRLSGLSMADLRVPAGPARMNRIRSNA
ncbi:VanZ family protein [Paeniglutamicibacter cryotolerans]|uniref:Glycopeptide antibiotics resistance protein n=1 Tax=Paeniglutamicibacter cryotolerans TaxID=670079 RepID=A0A839QLL7_9MICC|nr:VanZ family protein [Paeniglutamicibacter cryotolerans]MBB2997318.1 glycopeptide antibiotics resistance protein [Paeniglutamicibacter cryotolerans]